MPEPALLVLRLDDNYMTVAAESQTNMPWFDTFPEPLTEGFDAIIRHDGNDPDWFLEAQAPGRGPRQFGTTVYDRCLKPLLDIAQPARTLIVCAEQPHIHELPFEWAMDNRRTDEEFVTVPGNAIARSFKSDIGSQRPMGADVDTPHVLLVRGDRASPDFDVEFHAPIEAKLRDLEGGGHIRVTSKRLRADERLRGLSSALECHPDVLVLVAHGEPGEVYLGDKPNGADGIANVIKPTGVGIVVLAVCHSGDPTERSLAYQLLDVEVPIVIAPRGDVTALAMHAFTDAFFDEFVKRTSVELCVASGCRRVAERSAHGLRYGQILLYTSTRTFDISSSAAPSRRSAGDTLDLVVVDGRRFAWNGGAVWQGASGPLVAVANEHTASPGPFDVILSDDGSVAVTTSGALRVFDVGISDDDRDGGPRLRAWPDDVCLRLAAELDGEPVSAIGRDRRTFTLCTGTSYRVFDSSGRLIRRTELSGAARTVAMVGTATLRLDPEGRLDYDDPSPGSHVIGPVVQTIVRELERFGEMGWLSIDAASEPSAAARGQRKFVVAALRRRGPLIDLVTLSLPHEPGSLAVRAALLERNVGAVTVARGSITDDRAIVVRSPEAPRALSESDVPLLSANVVRTS